jgi:hypothetical protein
MTVDNDALFLIDKFESVLEAPSLEKFTLMTRVFGERRAVAPENRIDAKFKGSAEVASTVAISVDDRQEFVVEPLEAAVKTTRVRHRVLGGRPRSKPRRPRP